MKKENKILYNLKIFFIIFLIFSNICIISFIVDNNFIKNKFTKKTEKEKIQEIIKSIIDNYGIEMEKDQIEQITKPIIHKDIDNKLSKEFNSFKEEMIKKNQNNIEEYEKKLEKINLNNGQKINEENKTNDKEINNDKSLYNNMPSDTKFFPKNKTKFIPYDEIIGMSKEKEALEEILDYLTNTENYSYEKLGHIDAPKGVILYGCPGTGKTILARGLSLKAGDCVSFYEIPSPEFSCTYFGEAPEKVRNLFKDVRNNNKNPNIKASIIFLDECEEIFKNLSNLSENSSKDLANVVNQFKIELTSTENDPKKPIFIIGATNYFNQIDEAIKSRLDYHIEVKTLDQQNRKIFLDKRIKQRKNNYKPEALEYLLNDINTKIENYSEEKRANRVLEQLLNSIIRNIAKEKRNIAEIQDVQKGFEKIYNN
ncbi:AAA family ATPase [Candidatus Phytoplasma oryzae]|nr:ATP-binding protein [Candidatus Phytoplasma oryzae]